MITACQDLALATWWKYNCNFIFIKQTNISFKDSNTRQIHCRLHENTTDHWCFRIWYGKLATYLCENIHLRIYTSNFYIIFLFTGRFVLVCSESDDESPNSAGMLCGLMEVIEPMNVTFQRAVQQGNCRRLFQHESYVCAALSVRIMTEIRVMCMALSSCTYVIQHPTGDDCPDSFVVNRPIITRIDFACVLPEGKYGSLLHCFIIHVLAILIICIKTVLLKIVMIMVTIITMLARITQYNKNNHDQNIADNNDNNDIRMMITVIIAMMMMMMMIWWWQKWY